MWALIVTRVACMVIVALIPISAVLGLRYLMRRGNLRLAGTEAHQISSCAREAVLATEQRYKEAARSEETNRQKLAFARRHLLDNLRRGGISIDSKAAEAAIEAAIASNAQSVAQVQAMLAVAQTERAQWEARYTETMAMAEATQEEFGALRTELAHKDERVQRLEGELQRLRQKGEPRPVTEAPEVVSTSTPTQELGSGPKVSGPPGRNRSRGDAKKLK